jgi:hypothetical protein
MQNRSRCLSHTKILSLFLFWGGVLWGQNTDTLLVTKILEQWEMEFQVKFSYAPEDISELQIAPPRQNLSLQEALAYLEANTPVLVSQIDERYISLNLNNRKAKFCATLFASDTGEPLEGATVMAQGSSWATVSNREGVFSITDLSQDASITISHMGYRPLTIAVGKLSPNCDPLLLMPLADRLQPVLVQGIFTKGISKQLDGAFRIHTNKFGLLPGQVEDDVLQIAQALPGISSVDETISNINIRGGTTDQNLILWDDIKIYQNGHFFGLISAFDPNLTKKVTVYKNGSHPKYAEGVSGVIAMRSQDELTNDFSGGIGANLIHANAFLEVPLNHKASLQLSGRQSLNTLFESPVYQNYSTRIFQDSEIGAPNSPQEIETLATDEDFRFYDLSGKLLWNPNEQNAFRVHFLTMDNALNFTERNVFSNQSTTSTLEQRSLASSVSWAHHWSPRFTTNSMAYVSYYLLDANNKDIFTTQVHLQENEVLETGIKVDGVWTISEKLRLENGYQFTETGIANTQDVNLPRFRDYRKEVLRTHALFSYMQFTPNQKQTVLSAGVRANYFTKFNTLSVEPRLTVHQKLGSGFAVEAQGELKTQTTTQRIDFQSDFLGIEKRRWVLANDASVPILESRQVSLGLVYNKGTWFATAEGFWKEVEGITAANQGFQNQFQFRRASGSYRSNGVELAVNHKTERFSTWMSYVFMDTDYQFPDFAPASFPSNFDIRHTATLASSVQLKRLKLALGVHWHSGKPYTEPPEGNELVLDNGTPTIQFDSPNQERLEDYFRTDFSAEYLWELSQSLEARINLAIINLWDTENIINTRFAIDEATANLPQLKQIDERSLSFTPNFGVQLLF